MTVPGRDPNEAVGAERRLAVRTLYIVTHPQATHHVEGVVGGWHDSALTTDGQAHARAAATALRARIPPAAAVELVCSDLLRARQTAEAIATEFGVEARLDPRLREKSYGEAEGRPQSWLDARFVAPPPEAPRLTHDEGIERAETMLQMGSRVYAAMAELLPGETEHQIVATHGGALTFAVAAFLRLPLESLGFMRLRAVPGGITVLREDGFFHNRTLVELSAADHLDAPVNR